MNMDSDRIKKLVSSEYRALLDNIIIESPFAETTRDGHGVREVTLGLTPTKLIIASDVFHKNEEITCCRGVDPSIECFELLSVYPLKFITLSIFRRRSRRTLKARLISGRVTYYELGGPYNRRRAWSLWCKQIDILHSQKENGSSLSETTAASSSSSTTLYFLSSDPEFPSTIQSPGKPRFCRLWAHYGGAGDGIAPSWPRKDTYLGPSYNELGYGLYAPIPVRFAGASFDDLHIRYELRPVTLNPAFPDSNHSWPTPNSSGSRRRKEKEQNGGLCNVLYMHRPHRGPSAASNILSKVSSPDSASVDYDDYPERARKSVKRSVSFEKSDKSLAPKLSRFGFGIHENCTSGLYLQPHEGDPDHLVKIKPAYKLMDPYQLMESGVAIWEKAGSGKSRSSTKPSRRYGLATCPHFLFGLGPWSLHFGDKFSIQNKRSASLVSVRRQPIDEDFKLPVSKRQLSTSVSMTSLDPGMASAATTTRGRIVIFWTPDYWYRPRAATAVYQELRNHLNRLQDFHTNRQRSSRRSFFPTRNRSTSDRIYEDMRTCNKSSCILNKIFSVGDFRRKRGDITKSVEERSVSQLRRLLKMNLRITVWDLDSTTIAKQLTLIDRDLFLRIPATEIEIIIFQKSSRNAPNIGAWVAFSHRISCLTSSEILAIKKMEMRTRILSRFINVASKCLAIGNFNSSRSIVAGLQSPPIYRLKSTWRYLKVHHSTRYEAFTKLCKIFKNCRTNGYVKAWERAQKRPPLLPYVGHLVVRILQLDETEEVIEEMPRWTRKDYDCGCTYLCQTFEEERAEEQPRAASSSEKKSEVGLMRRLLSSTVGRIISKRPPSVIRCDVFWAARRMMMARRYFDRWKTCLLTTRIIKEYEEKKRNADWRKKRAQEVSLWLVGLQKLAKEFDFPGHALAWEFLLKARYREEMDNFYISLKLEPPLG